MHVIITIMAWVHKTKFGKAWVAFNFELNCVNALATAHEFVCGLAHGLTLLN
jgi:hypothetical protein